ncbi:FAD-binding protein [Peptoniphilus equinus]|uniref:FAD-binding protein n=1 Tax=Peptoniphilus equinus TaxID=3016343 RepID=A0ABY7QRE0_9FIRM|nr:FAD-binding protein [Peptoniphilus equinus]WBW49354.1 FAD-binding protein [Peptoniphilus equinus]
MSYIIGHDSDVPEFLRQPEPITPITDVKDYDIVIIGAGSPGVPCALRAKELGLKVCVVQKEATASACGNIGSGILVDQSSKDDIEKIISNEIAANDYRAKRSLIAHWAYHSGEAITWLIDKAKAAGCQITDEGDGMHTALNNELNTDVHFVTSVFGPKPYNTGTAMTELIESELAEGIDVFYNTCAEQLVKDGNRVIGVVAKTDDGYVQFNGKKGIVVATGDYQNDDAMLSYYLPDVVNLEKKKEGRTGDGHKMIVWAGGTIENIGHTKMCHDFDGGPAPMMSLPYLRVKRNGKRFANETVGMEYMNCFLLSPEDAGHYMQIFDSDYIEKSQHLKGGQAVPVAELKKFMPEEDVADRTGVIPDQMATFKADTLEALAEKLGITDAAAFVDTVHRYNDMAKAGHDTEMGVDADQMVTVDKAPFYGIHRHIRLTMCCSGVNINEHHQCLDADGNPIEGLFAIGNLAGNMYGAVDYPLGLVGINLGNNYTSGYTTANYIASL